MLKNNDKKYNQVVKDHYISDPDRQEYERDIKNSNRAEAIGYYSMKIVSGYLIGYVIGTILGILFLWFYVIKPWVLPILHALIDPWLILFR